MLSYYVSIGYPPVIVQTIPDDATNIALQIATYNVRGRKNILSAAIKRLLLWSEMLHEAVIAMAGGIWYKIVSSLVVITSTAVKNLYTLAALLCSSTFLLI